MMRHGISGRFRALFVCHVCWNFVQGNLQLIGIFPQSTEWVANQVMPISSLTPFLNANVYIIFRFSIKTPINALSFFIFDVVFGFWMTFKQKQLLAEIF